MRMRMRLRWIEVMPNTYPPDRLFFVILDSLDGEEEGGEGEQLAGLTQPGSLARASSEAGALAWLRLPLSIEAVLQHSVAARTRRRPRNSKASERTPPRHSRRSLNGRFEAAAQSRAAADQAPSQGAPPLLKGSAVWPALARDLATRRSSAEVMCVHVTFV